MSKMSQELEKKLDANKYELYYALKDFIFALEAYYGLEMLEETGWQPLVNAIKDSRRVTNAIEKG
jgi:hypothetical protein